MDPITLAIVAGVAAGLTKVGEQALVEAYTGLKDLLKRKFGAESSVIKAVEDVEANPESKSRPATLSEEVVKLKANVDPELLHAAELLLAQLQETPGGQTIIQQTITGNQNIVSGTGNITVTDSPR